MAFENDLWNPQICESAVTTRPYFVSDTILMQQEESKRRRRKRDLGDEEEKRYESTEHDADMHYIHVHVPIPLTTLCIHNIHVYRRAVFLHGFLGIDMLKSNEKFSTIHVYTILYVCVLHYTKIKSKQKFKIRNIKISLPTVILLYIHTYYMIHYILLPHI